MGGCRRSTCPEGCSGHGTCEYIDELAVDFYNRRGGLSNNGRNANFQANTGIALTNYVTDSDNTRQFHGFLYQLWDAQKIQGCKCDLGYSGPDCASRVAPKGDDPLTTVKSAMGVQAIQLSAQTGAFSIIYHDPYGGVWRTDGISSNSDDAIVAKSVQDALRALPNEVLEGVSVAKRTSAQTVCHRLKDGQQHVRLPMDMAPRTSAAAPVPSALTPPSRTSMSPLRTSRARLACSSSLRWTSPHARPPVRSRRMPVSAVVRTLSAR